MTASGWWLRRRLIERQRDTPGLTLAPAQANANGYSPLWQVELRDPRDFIVRLAGAGVANSVGTFGPVTWRDQSTGITTTMLAQARPYIFSWCALELLC
ncbi:MAG: hypothetical protein ACT4NY_22375 [Pseudonocardiales bacterium]